MHEKHPIVLVCVVCHYTIFLCLYFRSHLLLEKAVISLSYESSARSKVRGCSGTRSESE